MNPAYNLHVQFGCPVELPATFNSRKTVWCAVRVRTAAGIVTALHEADAPGLLFLRPHCQHPLQFNPFFAAADDYAEVLRRGLEQSRREKGDGHEETLAHLAALAAHFGQLGQPEAAQPFAEEHARLTAQIATRKQAEQSLGKNNRS